MAGAERATTAGLLGLARRRHAITLDQRIAFAAIAALDGASATAWQRMFLAHADVFALGAGAPRNDFRDWRSQVLYPRDEFWGGAPAKAALWFRNLHGALKRAEWSNAAYSAGVLSVYLSAVADPFNTVRSDAGDVVHDAWRRSVLSGFDALLAAGRPLASSVVILDDDPEFLVRALGAASTAAAARFENALAHYDLRSGVVAPDAGFDSVGRAIAAERLAAAVSLVAAVFGRALVMSSAEPAPAPRLWPAAVKWTAMLPLAAWRRSSAHRKDGFASALIHDEVQSTGVLDRFLPESARTVRDLYRAEVEAKRKKISVAEIFPFPARPRSTAPPVVAQSSSPADVVPIQARIEARRSAAIEPPRPAPARREPPPVRTRGEPLPPAANDTAIPARHDAGASAVATLSPGEIRASATHADAATRTLAVQPAEVVALAEHGSRVRLASAQPMAAAKASLAEITPRPMRDRDDDAAHDPAAGTPVTPDDDVVRAPSVGTRTAADLRRVGVDTLEDFAKVHPIALVARLEDATLDPERVEIWQRETRLLLEVPALSGSEARLLVGAGFDSRAALLEAGVETVCAALLRHALTPEGATALLDGPPPTAETLRALVERIVTAA